jgi:NADH dehydrogenase FAD-containing subunit
VTTGHPLYVDTDGVITPPLPRVVVIGTGIAAVEATLLLHSRLSGRVDLRVVSDSDRFLYRPNLVYVPFGAEGSELDMEMVLANRGIPLQVQPVEGVDSGMGRVHLADGSRLPYEHLVIATGASAVPHEVPGLEEHAVTLSGSSGALGLRERFTHLRGQAREGSRGRVLFVIPCHIGCALPLYEVALMLDTWLRRERAREPVGISLVTHEQSFAESCGPRMHDVIERELARRDMKGRAGERLTAVRAGEAAFAGGRIEPFDLLVAIPLQGPAVRYGGLPTDERGFVRVEAGTRRVLGHPEIYAPGDAGDFPLKDASLALLGADAVGDHIKSVVTGGDFKRPFDAVTTNVVDMLDTAAFAHVPLELSGDRDHPVRVRAGSEPDYKVGVSPAWRKSKRVFASSLLTRFAVGEPLRAGPGWHLMEAGARAMAGTLAD